MRVDVVIFVVLFWYGILVIIGLIRWCIVWIEIKYNYLILVCEFWFYMIRYEFVS